MSESAAFERVGEDLEDYYRTMRGHIRHELVREYLTGLLYTIGPRSGELIDVGCGDGRDARALNGAGFEFRSTLTDPNSEILVDARRNNPQGTKTIRADINSVARRPSLQDKFDLVLSHGVIQSEIENPSGHVEKLVRLGKPGSGVISVLAKGFGYELDKLTRKKVGRDELDTFKDTGFSRDEFGNLTVAHQMHELEHMLKTAGATILMSYGIGSSMDSNSRNWAEVPFGQRLDILKKEYRDGIDKLMRHRGEMLLVLARRDEAS